MVRGSGVADGIVLDAIVSIDSKHSTLIDLSTRRSHSWTIESMLIKESG